MKNGYEHETDNLHGNETHSFKTALKTHTAYS